MDEDWVTSTFGYDKYWCYNHSCFKVTFITIYYSHPPTICLPGTFHWFCDSIIFSMLLLSFFNYAYFIHKGTSLLLLMLWKYQCVLLVFPEVPSTKICKNYCFLIFIVKRLRLLKIEGDVKRTEINWNVGFFSL